MPDTAKIAARYLRALGGQGTLQSNRNTVLENDVLLARNFRDAVVRLLRSRIKEIDRGAPYGPQTWMDGDRKMLIEVPSWAGHHPSITFEIDFPPDPFFQFAYGNEEMYIVETRTDTKLQLPTWGERGTPSTVADAFVVTLRGYVSEGWRRADPGAVSRLPGTWAVD